MKRLLRTAWLAIGVFVVWTAPAAAATASPASPSGGGSLLQDKAVWDIKLFQAYCKCLWQTDVPDKVATYPGQYLITNQFNPEFVKRLEAMISFYQARGHNDIGIVPGDGAFRTPAQQHKLYEIGRVLTPPTASGTHESDWFRPDHSEIATGNWIGWHNFGLAADFCQYDGAAPKLVPIGTTGKTGITLPFKSVDWVCVFENVAPDLGFFWGGWWHDPHDPGHVEWHPNRHKPAALEATGLPDPQFTDLYTSQIPQTLYMWSGDSQDSDAKGQVLYCITVVYDQHWVAVQSARRITRGKNLGWTGVWTTFDPPVRLFPGYVPTDNFTLNPNPLHVLDNFTYTSTVHSTSEEVYADQGKNFSAYDGSARFYPQAYVLDCETAADRNIGLASPPPKPDEDLKTTQPKLYNALLTAHNYRVALQKKTEAEFTAVEDTSTYDVHASVCGIDPPKDQPYDIAMRSIFLGTDGYTTGDPNDVHHLNFAPRGPAFDFVWVRPTGQIGVHDLLASSKSEYDPLKVESLRVFPNKAFVMVSPTLPSGAFDQPTPPSWPTPNPKPTTQPAPTPPSLVP